MEQLFIGYDKDFYDAIPYVKVEPGPNEDPYPQRWAIEPSFVGIASKPLFQRNNAKVYEEYGLPDDDEIRGFILAHPELLFYAPELKKVWELLDDKRHFLKALKDQIPLSALLHDLHFYELVFISLKLFRDALGEDAFFDMLNTDEGWFPLSAAIYYWALSDTAKQNALECIKRYHSHESVDRIFFGTRYSSPVYDLDRHRDDRVIGDYSFERIGSERTSEELTELFSVPLKEFFFDLYFIEFKHYAIYNKQKTPIALLRIEERVLKEIVTDRDVSLTENGLLAAILNWLLEVGYSMGKDTFKEEGE